MRSTTDLRECVNTLVDMTLAGGSPDNITIAVVEVAEAHDDDAAPPVSIPPARQAAGERDNPVGDGGSTSQEIDRNGDLPGAAIRADIIRRDLLTRPHVLVGSAALATETGQIPIVTQRSTERRAAMMLTHGADPGGGGETEDGTAPARGPRWLVPAFLSLMTLILIAVVGFGYTWTQTRYYVAETDNRVAIYTGVPQSLGPVSLSKLYETTDIPVSNLPEYQRSQVMSSLPAASLEEAERIVGDLRSELRAVACAPEGSGGGTPAPSPTVSGTPAPSPTSTSPATGTPTASATTAPSGVASPRATPGSGTPGPNASGAPGSPTASATASSGDDSSASAIDCGGTASE
jgi:hypothetical protein